jgi:hypothetical protein
MKTIIIIITIWVTWLFVTSTCDTVTGDARRQCHSDSLFLVAIPAIVGIVIGCITAWLNVFQGAAALLAPFIGWAVLLNVMAVYDLFERFDIVRTLAVICLYSPIFFIHAVPAIAACLLSQQCYVWLRDN